MKMEFNAKDTMSDEEEDLESLRLAALQTIKKPASNVIALKSNAVPSYKVNKYNASPQGKRRFQGMRQRNGQFNNRARNSNLIAIMTVPSVEPDEIVKKNPFSASEPAPKLVLPQDRYCNSSSSDSKPVEVATKFSRYDNSDKSDSDSEVEEEVDSGPDASPRKLERSNSLEALMQELENEIQGDSKLKPQGSNKVKVKVKKIKKVVNAEQVVEQKENEPAMENKSVEIVSHESVEVKNNSPPNKKFPKSTLHRKKPSPLKWIANEPPPHLMQQNAYQPPYIPQPMPYQPFLDPQLPYSVPYQAPIQAPRSVLPEIHHHPQRFNLQRPLSPLSLNAEVLSTVTMAPLSPRSAAFVLQNREIIERRKRSPKRSYSRSPSPLSSKSSESLRRSRSPLHRHSSPKRGDSLKDVSPKNGRKVAPRPRPYNSQPSSKTDLTKFSLAVEQKSKKAKLGGSLSLSPSPERNRQKISSEDKSPGDVKPKEDKIDPILEARRRKFESNEIGKKEGVIRLRPKSEGDGEEIVEEPATNEEEEEPVKDDESVIDLKVDDLFSDEESEEDENEGRFKAKPQQETKQNVPILPFTQLLGETKRIVKTEPLLRERGAKRPRERHHRDRRERKRPRSKSPPPRENIAAKDKGNADYKHSVGSDKKSGDKSKNRVSSRAKLPVAVPVESKKIEIKIKNPTKYNDNVKEKKKTVEVSKEEEPEPEIVIENDDEEVENAIINNKSEGGDLRAQLSRKRAERQNKYPLTDGVPSRILQNALEGAVFKKVSKIKKTENTAPKDGKIPIRLRLGGTDKFNDVKTRKKASRKRKNLSEQV